MVEGTDQPLPGPSVTAYSSELSPATDSAAPTGRRAALLVIASRDARRPATAAITTGTFTRNTEPQ